MSLLLYSTALISWIQRAEYFPATPARTGVKRGSQPGLARGRNPLIMSAARLNIAG